MRFMETGIVGARVIDPIRTKMSAGGSCARGVPGSSRSTVSTSCPSRQIWGSAQQGDRSGHAPPGAPAIEAKLVRCTRGAIFDVVLDLRPESPSYGEWYGRAECRERPNALRTRELCARIPDARGRTEMYYMTSAFYTPSAVRGVRFDDPAFGIQWPLVATVVSEQDRNWPLSVRQKYSIARKLECRISKYSIWFSNCPVIGATDDCRYRPSGARGHGSSDPRRNGWSRRDRAGHRPAAWNASAGDSPRGDRESDAGAR